MASRTDRWPSAARACRRLSLAAGVDSGPSRTPIQAIPAASRHGTVADDHHHPPVEPGERPAGADEMRQRRPQGQGADQHAHGQAPAATEPSGRDLQADRVDGGDPGPAQRSQRDAGGEVDRVEAEGRIRGRGDQGASRHEVASRDGVGRAGECDDQGPDREADLDRDGEERGLDPRDSPAVREEGRDRRHAEPGDEGEEHRGRQDRELAPAAGRLGGGRARHAGSGSIV